MTPKYRAWLDPDMYDEPVIHNGKFYLDWRDFEDGNTYDLAVLMQSTGLFDKNGVEIFEGDVVNFMVPNQMISGTYQIRQAKSGEWRLDNRVQGRPLYISGSYHCEVVGNVWEDGDLLESVEE
ncbi:TPA: hypothetical protein VK294_000933 [Streptococcus pyogenes]|nr:hypothetical protein [Streptococcus pyogenes]HER5614759.1 hypothetical protein [Streptococcus pyogenes]